MHWFTFLSTVLIIFVAGTHVLIFGIQAKAAEKAHLLRRLAQLRRSRRALPAVIRVQRRVRVYLLRKHLALQAVVEVDGGMSSAQQSAGGLRKRHHRDQVVPMRVHDATTEEDVETADPVNEPSNAEVKAAGPRSDSRDGEVARAVLNVMSNKTLQRKGWRELMRRASDKVNDAFEYFCVYFLAYLNWMCAIAFVVGYALMAINIFRGAYWNNPGEPPCA